MLKPLAEQSRRTTRTKKVDLLQATIEENVPPSLNLDLPSHSPRLHSGQIHLHAWVITLKRDGLEYDAVRGNYVPPQTQLLEELG